MNLIQFFASNGERAVGQVVGDVTRQVNDATSVYDLALAALARNIGIGALIAEKGLGATVDKAVILAEGRMLAPVDHPDPAHRFGSEHLDGEPYAVTVFGRPDCRHLGAGIARYHERRLADVLLSIKPCSLEV